MNRMICTLLTLGVAMASFAIDERLERINTVKKSNDYLYGEATMATQEEATSLAYEHLQKEEFSWAERDSIQLKVKTPKDINSLADTIMTRRADMFRVFVYIEKLKLLPVVDTIETVKVDSMTVTKDSMFITDRSKQVLRKKFFGKDAKKKQRESDALLRIKDAKNFFELKKIMQPLKEKGDIIDYGKYATVQKPELCYLIIYDPAGNICALLGKGKDVRPNLKTGKEDTLRNYRGCGAIWFLLKEE